MATPQAAEYQPTKIRPGDPARWSRATRLAFRAAVVYLGLFAWGGLWFRDPRVRAMIPFRR